MNVWRQYFILYVMFILASISIETKLNRKVKFVHIWTSFIKTINVKWSKVIPTVIIFHAIFSLFVWTFNVFYGINLWSSLVGQVFEPEVNKWDDISFMDTQFVLLMESRYVAFGPTLMLANVFFLPKYYSNDVSAINPSENNLPKIHPISSKHISLVTKHMENAQLVANPSDIVFVMNKRTYSSLGKSVAKLGITYKLRLSRKPLKEYYYLKNRGKKWTIARYSVFTELASYAILRIQVMFIQNKNNTQTYPTFMIRKPESSINWKPRIQA